MLRSTAKIKLEAIGLQHGPKMLSWVSRPEVAENIGLRKPPSARSTLDWIRKAMSDSTICAFAILNRERHVGNVVLDQIDTYLSSARLSVYIGEPEERGKGTGSTAIYLALKHAFNAKNLHKIWLTVHLHNSAAIRVYAKLGFLVEGILREEFWLNKRRTDVMRMSLLAREFEDDLPSGAL